MKEHIREIIAPAFRLGTMNPDGDVFQLGVEIISLEAEIERLQGEVAVWKMRTAKYKMQAERGEGDAD